MKSLKTIWKKLIPTRKYIQFLRKEGVDIGEDCEIYKSANFGTEPYLIKVGNHVRIGPRVQLFTHDGGLWVLRYNKSSFFEEYEKADKFGRIIIEDNVHIGANSIIMPGVRIGANSIVACGAVVTHDVEPGTIVGGVPARYIETVEEYAKKQRNYLDHTKYMSPMEKKKYLLAKYDL